MWLCVVIVFSGVIYFWFGSFQTNLVALLNPTEIETRPQSQLASLSPLGEIKAVLKDLGANLLSLFDFISGDDQEREEIINRFQKIQPKRLPISR